MRKVLLAFTVLVLYSVVLVFLVDRNKKKKSPENITLDYGISHPLGYDTTFADDSIDFIYMDSNHIWHSSMFADSVCLVNANKYCKKYGIKLLNPINDTVYIDTCKTRVFNIDKTSSIVIDGNGDVKVDLDDSKGNKITVRQSK